MSSSLTMPSGGVREITWIPQSAVAVTTSPFSYAKQVHKFPAQARQVKIKLAPMSAATARNWIAFFARLNGPEGTFFLSDTVGQNPTLSRGTPTVNGASQTGKEIVYAGGIADTILVNAGEWLSIGNRLHQATEGASSDGSGEGILRLWPEVMDAPFSGASIEVDNPRGRFRLDEIPSYTWSVNRLMQGVVFTATEVVKTNILDFLNIEPVFAASVTRDLYGGFGGPRYLGTSKIYDQTVNRNHAFPNASGAAVTQNADNSWLFPTTTTKAMLNFGRTEEALQCSAMPNDHTAICVINTNSQSFQMLWSRGSTGTDWFGRSYYGSTGAPNSGVTVGDFRVNGTVVNPKTTRQLYLDTNGVGKLVLTVEAVQFQQMSGTFAFGVQHATFGFRGGSLYELMVIPDLSATKRDVLIDNIKAAHGIS